jgi:hypothetical protein
LDSEAAYDERTSGRETALLVRSFPTVRATAGGADERRRVVWLSTGRGSEVSLLGTLRVTTSGNIPGRGSEEERMRILLQVRGYMLSRTLVHYEID